ncbi:P-loop containing nucleoside triphosphate hydrolase protein [Lasiosphaeria miniovina]|uniref:P-loop containing nucleoside triphosphate hydrolase protein n=1 Tax=Lasiosphaeria miniovina TaxID=1954250 RepID=A0AA40AJF8_9PEZI|nr:P-loop containing nucleoside triphosphate hydrolase protein [Lasiosphaeria miniovina]KAK0716875.1 P-loop containing nucleoside triphosphate hydrolase protein [Lasiosphaeria miniovina]
MNYHEPIYSGNVPKPFFVVPPRTSQAVVIIDPDQQQAGRRQELRQNAHHGPGSSAAPVADLGGRDGLLSQGQDHMQAQARLAPGRAETVLVHTALGQMRLGRGATGSSSSSSNSGSKRNSLSLPETTDHSDSDRLSHGFDVYATPFVPEALRIVNSLPSKSLWRTPPAKFVHFSQYAANALRLVHLLPAITDPDIAHLLSLETLEQEPPRLTQHHYERFFAFHLGREILSQHKENATYALFGHAAKVDFATSTTAHVTLSVPGLRENSPYVEEDDEVYLRQLRLDLRGYLPPGFCPWTEVIYHARVLAVMRAREELVLAVLGLTPVSSEVRQPLLHFNVEFPVPQFRYSPMLHALSQVQASLLKASRTTGEYQNWPAVTIPRSDTNQYWMQSMLFPTEADCEVQANAQWGIQVKDRYTPLLNAEQRVAVENVCLQNYGVVPYLISGPPGTGKTTTMIEIALQLVNCVANLSHILVCAPSEQATDALAERLRCYFTNSEMLRLNRPTRTFAEVSDTLLPYCCVTPENGYDVFTLPPFERLMRYKVVVTSCRDASMLLHARMTNLDLYTVEEGLHSLARTMHPAVDAPAVVPQAAQATEPETLVPISVVAPPNDAPDLVFTPLLVMAGDEHQLNPRTSLQQSSPLQHSLFARLFSRPVYANHPLARRFVYPLEPAPPVRLPMLRPAFANLVRNYRSHPAILAIPSQLFYADTLIPEAKMEDTDRLVKWSGWPRQHSRQQLGPAAESTIGGFLTVNSLSVAKQDKALSAWPVLLHDNLSPDELERDGGGWYNLGEAQLAVNYAQRLVASGLVRPEEVCIMSPFKAQVRRLRKLMKEIPLTKNGQSTWGVNIGPTEAFQGLEFGVVILCTTRSRRRFVAKDKTLGWGIIGMPNKLNVALTRAKFGLIAIGDRKLLAAEDPEVWDPFVGFCERNGLLQGLNGRCQASVGNGTVTRIEQVLLASDGKAADWSSMLAGTVLH